LKLNTRARYALTAMVTISRLADADRPASVRWLGRRTRISRSYLGSILTRLVEAGLLRSQCGRGGGFTLALPAGAIGLGEIVQAVAGPINIIECVGRPEVCLLAEVCTCRNLYAEINERIVAALNRFTLADLACQSGFEGEGAAALVRGTGETGGSRYHGIESGTVPCRSLGVAD
jgi:Rrf2 family protein